MKKRNLAFVDPDIHALVEQEKRRQTYEINLIASENYVSDAVLEVTGSELTNKYAEGYPGKRYYGGCQYVDEAELLAIDRAKTLFRAEHANVQPHSGSSANMAVYASVLKPGDLIMGMKLAAGGHLTHGHQVNFSGTLYASHQYDVNPATELLDYDDIEHLAHLYRPKLLIAGASAYSRTIDFERFGSIARAVGAYFMADIAHIAGLIVAGLHPNPFPYADFVTTTTHKTLRGPRGGMIMCKEQFKDQIDRAIMPGLQGGPLMHIIAGKAVAFKEAMSDEFKTYQRQVVKNAHTMASAFTERGYRIVTGGTDNHLFTVDLRSRNLTGKAAQELLEQAGIAVNRNAIPNDPEKPWITSGVRIGTPAITTRGCTEREAIILVDIIDRVFSQQQGITSLKKEITDLTATLL